MALRSFAETFAVVTRQANADAELFSYGANLGRTRGANPKDGNPVSYEVSEDTLHQLTAITIPRFMTSCVYRVPIENGLSLFVYSTTIRLPQE